MHLEDYFDFLSSDDIRVKGHRIGIETILFEYVERSRCPEEIQQTYPSLSLEQVYATILFYLHEPKKIGGYFSDWLAWCEQVRTEAHANPSLTALRFRGLKDEISTYPLEEQDEARQRIVVREQLNRTKQTIPAEALK